MAERRGDQRQRGERSGGEQGTRSTSGGADAKIARLARLVGNDTLQERLESGNSSRDAMLDHITERLRVMRELQLREIDLSHRGSHFPYWRQVADANKPEISAPEPTRWNEAARLFERAAQLLCQGDLKRGRDLLEQATAEEQRARESLTTLVFTEDIERFEAQPALPPPSGVSEVAGACDLPPEVGLAREIQHVTTEGPDIPNRGRARDPWWTLDEEEEQEETGDAGGP